MFSMESGALNKAGILREIFVDYACKIAEALGRAGISLQKVPELHQNAVIRVVGDFDRYERLKNKRLSERYGTGANTLHLITVPIMAHLPVSLSVFHGEHAAYGEQLANALYAIAVAFTYLEIQAEDADDVIIRLTTHLMARHTPMKVEANLAALRGFLDAYVQKRLFLGPRVLRERLAIA